MATTITKPVVRGSSANWIYFLNTDGAGDVTGFVDDGGNEKVIKIKMDGDGTQWTFPPAAVSTEDTNVDFQTTENITYRYSYTPKTIDITTETEVSADSSEGMRYTLVTPELSDTDISDIQGHSKPFLICSNRGLSVNSSGALTLNTYYAFIANRTGEIVLGKVVNGIQLVTLEFARKKVAITSAGETAMTTGFTWDAITDGLGVARQPAAMDAADMTSFEAGNFIELANV